MAKPTIAVRVLLAFLSAMAVRVHAAQLAQPRAGPSASWSVAGCAAVETDEDRDGLDDRCEMALAHAFAPELIVDAGECLWRSEAPAPRLAGGYLFAAERTPRGGGVRIAYLPAYYRDCGWTGVACVLRGGSCSAHAGDSELVVIDLVADAATARWRTVGVFLSAHCLGRSDGRCRWYRDEALRAFTWVGDVPGGAPRVWVARGKHAHYPSRRACDQGHWFYDSCDGNRVTYRFPVLSTRQNIGSRERPLPGDGCVAAEALPLGPSGADLNSRECLWDAAAPFWGWQADRAGTAPTSYGRHLAMIAGF